MDEPVEQIFKVMSASLLMRTENICMSIQDIQNSFIF